MRIKANGLCSPEQISHFEVTNDVSLPEEYKRFLLINNGGIPSPDAIDIPGMTDGPTDIQVFFGFDTEDESISLAWNFELFSGSIPNVVSIPIACDSFGSRFCILPSEDSKIYYLDGMNDKKIAYEVAVGFSEFIEKVRAA